MHDVARTYQEMEGESFNYEFTAEKEWGEVFNENELNEFASELLEVSNERELEQFLGKLQPNTRDTRRTAEHALIRALILSRTVPEGHLRNEKSRLSFRVKGSVSLQNLFPDTAWGNKAARAPNVVDRALALSDKALYELFGR